jgi:hypothetical protein
MRLYTCIRGGAGKGLTLSAKQYVASRGGATGEQRPASLRLMEPRFEPPAR